MTAASVSRRVAASVEEVWDRVTHFPGHAPHVPLTTIPDPGPLALGATVVPRTAVGPLGFDDPMTVTSWTPPPAPAPSLRVVKTGRLLGGWAEIVVRPVDGGAEVVWTEEITLEPTPLRPALGLLHRVLDPVAARSTQAMVARVLDGLLADLPQLPSSPAAP